ncbi:MAG: hypothetical protein ACYSTS_05170 [Planctomycetota bacterium]|jgi:hypothetical protein
MGNSQLTDISVDKLHMKPTNQYRRFVLIGVIAAVIFVMISSVSLTGQGLYHDEAIQATASFAYNGIMPEMYSQVSIKGLPILNTVYTAAMKSGIYGLYLKFSGSNFTVMSWRLTGIIFVGIGIILFCIYAGPGMSSFCLISFLFLFITDITLILATRHDWGPVALGILLRLILIATWVYGETKDSTSKINSFFPGFLVSIAVFEKLSSVVLILPLMLMFFFSVNRRSIKHYISCIIGLVIGGIPLIFVNLYTYLQNGECVTLMSLRVPEMHGSSDFSEFLSHYISIGHGSILKFVILGTDLLNTYKYAIVEKYFLSTILLLTTVTAICYWKHNKSFRISGVMLLSYIVVGITLYLLPASTWVHHWLIGTPFQYIAISFALVGLHQIKATFRFHFKLFYMFFVAILIIFVIIRCIGLASVERSFSREATSELFDASITEFGHLASNRTEEAVFFAADHGIATQIYCFSNGYPHFVYELFADYKGPEQIRKIIEQSGKKIIYVVVRNPSMQLIPENTEKIFQDIDAISDWLPGWHEVSLENEMAELKAVNVRKYVYIGN